MTAAYNANVRAQQCAKEMLWAENIERFWERRGHHGLRISLEWIPGTFCAPGYYKIVTNMVRGQPPKEAA